MLSFLSGLLHGIVTFLTSFLPDSPLRAFGDVLEGAELGLGWLNWFVPVGAMLTVFLAWLAALLVWAGVQLVTKYSHMIGDGMARS